MHVAYPILDDSGGREAVLIVRVDAGVVMDETTYFDRQGMDEGGWMELMDKPVAVIEPDGRILYVNGRMVRWIGKEAVQLQGRLLSELLPSQAEQWLRRHIRTSLSSGEVVRETLFQGAAGDKNAVRVHLQPLADKGDSQRKVMVSVEDITEHWWAKKKLNMARSLNTTLLATAPIPIIVIGPDTSVRHVNPAFTSLMGFTSAELVDAKAPYPWWPRKDGPLVQAFKSALEHGATDMTQRFRKKSGQTVTVRVCATPVREKGKLQYYLSTWTPLPDRRSPAEADDCPHAHVVDPGERLLRMLREVAAMREQSPPGGSARARLMDVERSMRAAITALEGKPLRKPGSTRSERGIS